MTSPQPNRLENALRYLERYTKTDMVYLAHGGFWFSLGQVISSLSALLLALAFANFLPQETYGTYKYILSIAGIFSLFALPNMADAVTRAVARGEDPIVYAATNERIKWSFLGVAVSLVGAGYYHFIGGNELLAAALLVVACTLPVFDTFNLYDAYLAGKRRFGDQAKYHALINLISIPLLIAAAYFTSNLIIILLAYFIPQVALRFALYRHLLKGVPHDAPADPSTLAYGRHLTAMNILGVLAGNIDKILIFKFLGASDVAIYTFAVAIPEQLKGPLKGVAAIALPKFASQTHDQIRKGLPSLFYKLILYAVVITAVSGLYFFAAPYIYHFLFPAYESSILYSQIFMFSAIGLVGTVPLSILAAQKKTKEQYLFFTSQPVLQIILYLVCIPAWGIMGAILARVIMRVIYIIQSWMMLKSTFDKEEQPT